MVITGERFLPECIGNVRVEFFTALGSFTLEAWRGTHDCKVTTYCGGLRRSVKQKLDDAQWFALVRPLTVSGFWRWDRRYDGSGTLSGPVTWCSGIMTDYGWFYSSGEGCCPEGLYEMLRGLTEFTASLENRRVESASVFLSPMFGAEVA